MLPVLVHPTATEWQGFFYCQPSSPQTIVVTLDAGTPADDERRIRIHYRFAGDSAKVVDALTGSETRIDGATNESQRPESHIERGGWIFNQKKSGAHWMRAEGALRKESDDEIPESHDACLVVAHTCFGPLYRLCL